jgi:hypothetical protein
VVLDHGEVVELDGGLHPASWMRTAGLLLHSSLIRSIPPYKGAGCNTGAQERSYNQLEISVLSL